MFLHFEILIVIMVLIDSASKELSNGGRFVNNFDQIIGNFDLGNEILGLEPDLALPTTF